MRLKTLIIGICIILALLNTALAQETYSEEELEQMQESLQNEWDDDMATEYLSQIGMIEGFSEEDMEIAETYFSDINNLGIAMTDPTLRGSFENYYYQKTGCSMNLEGDLAGYDPYSDSFLPSGPKAGEFKNFMDLPAGSTITVNEDGSVSICKAGTDCGKTQIRLSGEVEYNAGKNSYKVNGEINGHEIEKGRNIIFDKNGNLRSAIAKTFETDSGKVEFKYRQGFTYDAGTDTLRANGAKIKTIEGDITIEGKNIQLPKGDKLHKGKVTYTNDVPSKIGSKTDITVNKVRHKTEKDTELDLYSYENFPKDIQQKLDRLNKQKQKALKKAGANRLVQLQKKLDKTKDPTEFEKLSIQMEKIEHGMRSIERDHLEKTGEVYGDLIMTQPKGSNFFIYGANDDKIVYASGSSYTSKVDRFFGDAGNNNIEIEPRGGSISLAKISQDGYPLALAAKTTGGFKIDNGHSVIDSEGDDVYYSKQYSGVTGVDMVMQFTSEDGESKYYDLEVNTRYRDYLTPSERRDLKQQMSNIDQKKAELQHKIDVLLNDKNVKKVVAEIDELDKRKEPLLDEIARVEKNIKRAERAGDKAAQQSLTQKLIGMYDEVNKLAERKIQLEENSGDDFNTYFETKGSMNTLDFKRRRLELKLQTEQGKGYLGAFSQILTSDDGSAELTYSSFIQDYPVVENEGVRFHYDERYDPKLQRNIGKKRVSPYFSETEEWEAEKADRLDLVVDSRVQDCAGTQMELILDFKKQLFDKGKIHKITFGDETFTGGDYEAWKKNIQRSHSSGMLFSDPTITTDVTMSELESEGLQPGDIIVEQTLRRTAEGKYVRDSGYGHSMGVKDIHVINGKRYYELFAGSDPAMDAGIGDETHRPRLVSEAYLKYLISMSQDAQYKVKRFK